MIIFLTAALVGVGFAQVCIYFRQASIMETQACIMSQQTEISTATERAFVTISELTMESSLDNKRTKNFWYFRPKATNSGNTPTKDMKYLATATFGPTKPEAGWNSLYPDVAFPDAPPPPDWLFHIPIIPPREAVLGPHATAAIDLGGIGVHADDLEKNVNQKSWRYYVYGIITYRDIFPDTKIHVTKYCYSLGITRASTNERKPTSGLCRHWNCIEEQCEEDYRAYVDEVSQAFTKAGKRMPDDFFQHWPAPSMERSPSK